jgi:uncharacterized Ntn-hydrolase superfamily protein
MKTRLIFLFFLGWLVTPCNATYSILGFDPETGEIGGGVQSCVPTVTMVLHGEGDVGMVAAQGRPRPEYGKAGLKYLRSGFDPLRAVRAVHEGGFFFTPWGGSKYEMQFAIMDRQGRAAAYTGPQCSDYAGHQIGRHCIAQGNLVESSRVVSGMVYAFETTKGPLKYRLMAALEAAQANGGDRRGMMSAAMLIVKNGSKERNGVVLDIAENMNFFPLVGLRAQLEQTNRSAPFWASSDAIKENRSRSASTTLRKP